MAPVDSAAPSSDPLRIDLDEAASLQECLKQIRSPGIENFAVRFDASTAHCATNLAKPEIVKLLDRGQQSGSQTQLASQTLWLNFWAGDAQKDTIKAIAAHYNVSPRLTDLLCPVKPPGQTGRPPVAKEQSTRERLANSIPKWGQRDIERADGVGALPKLTRKVSTSTLLQGMSFAQVVSSLWHFCSVDWGQHYLYVGYNSLLSKGSQGKEEDEDENDNEGKGKGKGKTMSRSKTLRRELSKILNKVQNDDQNKPSGQRMWTSLLFCDDNIVISVFERPSRVDFATEELYSEVIEATTRNVGNVFRHLSRKNPSGSGSGALTRVKIRPDEPSDRADNKITQETADQASLLFYYLFDDWASTFALIAGLEHPYRDTLDLLREGMFEFPDTNLVATLHAVGRQLTVLKQMYQSYELIVARILQRQRTVRNRNRSSAHHTPLHHHDHATARIDEYRPRTNDSAMIDQMVQEEAEFGADEATSVRLSLAAVVRFERLLDRIRLYALTEIEECLKEKDSLVFMNFNLVTLKESSAVEKLTRTTVLLAKATILFLPVSLMTAYFSIQLPEVAEIYSLKTYWLCFLVVSVVSVLFLVGMSEMFNRVEGRTVYRSLFQLWWEKGLGRWLLWKGSRGKGNKTDGDGGEKSD